MSTETNSTRFFYSLYYIVGKGCLCVCSFGACNLLFYVELQQASRCGGEGGIGNAYCVIRNERRNRNHHNMQPD